MEELDRRIVGLLMQDGRMSFTDLGKVTGLSTSAVHQRVRRLEERGVIQGYRAVIDHDALGMPLVAFISVTKVLPALRTVLSPAATAVVLVKPQFEVGRGQVGPGGIVKDPELHLQALRAAAASAQTLGYAVVGACPSPVLGAEGNREFFLHLVVSGQPLGEAALEDRLRDAARPVNAVP